MAHQASVNGSGATPPTGRSVTGGPISQVAHDVLELAELQARLFKLDVDASTSRVKSAVVLGAIGATLLLMGLFMALGVAALALIEFAGWDAWAAFGAVALAVIIISGLLLFLAKRAAGGGVFNCDRSKDELQKNVAWLKSALSGKHSTSRGVDEQVRA